MKQLVSHARQLSYAFLIIALLVSCAKSEEVNPTFSEYQESVISYFKDIALGFENGGGSEITRKWVSPMKIFIGGNTDENYRLETIRETVATINELSTEGFSVEVVEDSARANTYIFFGSSADFIRRFPDAQGQIGSNFGIFNVWWNASNQINRARVFIDIERANRDQQISLIIEELTQSLGLGMDSPRYPDSIFYETPSNGGFVTSYSQRDRDIIRLLYHPMMKLGLNRTGVDPVLRQILLEEG